MEKADPAMDKPRSGPSLTVFLQPQSNDALGIDLIRVQNGKSADASNGLNGDLADETPSVGAFRDEPFSVIDTCGPFARILPADLTMGRRNRMLPLFLLVQADQYPPGASELNPLYNPDVEAYWRNTLTRYHENRPAGLPLAPVSQKDDQGAWLPFRPLFFCGMTNRFCHPHCPECGGELDLCRDDQLLEACGLPEFSRSLERFLFCPSCLKASAPPVFYSKATGSGEISLENGAKLRNCLELVQDFGRLQQNNDLAGEFPCVGCRHGDECFGSDHRVVSRMTPVSFYPFYMLVSPAPDLNLADFAMLLSGASPEEVALKANGQQRLDRLEIVRRFQSKTGQEKGLFFTEGDSRFLEVLYLKLTLMHDLMTLSVNDPGILNTPMERMSLENFWVSFGEQSRRLPFLWTFDLKMIDVVGEAPSFELEKCREHRFLGLAWLHILLVNHRQDAKKVFTGVNDFLQREEILDPEQPIPDDMMELLASSNLLWQAESIELSPQGEFFWRKALALGISLLKSGINADTGWPEREFDEKLTELRSDIRLALFQTDERKAPAAEAGPGRDDSNIAAIVDDILLRWPGEPEGGIELKAEEPSGPPQSVTPVSPDADGDVEETIILATGQGEIKTTPPEAEKIPETSGSPDKTPDTLEETVVMRMPPGTDDDDLEKTMVMNAPPLSSDNELDKTVVMHPAEPEPETDQQEKTMVITRPPAPSGEVGNTSMIGVSAHISTGKQPQGRHTAPADNIGGTGDDLDQTVVIAPPGQAGPGKTEPSSLKSDMKDEDELEKTVIIDPKQLNNRKPKP